MKLALFLASLLYGIYMTPAQPSCDDLKVKAEVTHTTNGLNNGEVEVVVEGGERPYYYFFYEEDGKPLSKEHKSNSILLEKGNYKCTVYDKNGCRKTIDFIIK